MKSHSSAPSPPQSNTTKKVEWETGEVVQVVKQQPEPILPIYLDKLLQEPNKYLDPLPSISPIKSYPPESTVARWLDSVSEPEHCRESYQGLEIPRCDLTSEADLKAVNMEYSLLDRERFPLPIPPADAIGSAVSSFSEVNRSGSQVNTSNFTGSNHLVQNSAYRTHNLALNNIYMHHLWQPLPERITSLVKHIRMDTGLPGQSMDQVIHDVQLRNLWMQNSESNVGDYFRRMVFYTPEDSDSLLCTAKTPMAIQVVPTVVPSFKISTPVPDLVYGYQFHKALSAAQRIQLATMTKRLLVNRESLTCPFFVIEFKGDSGSLWTATNQCLGGSVACVNVAERINSELKRSNTSHPMSIESAAFSIAISGSEARLYVTWQDDDLNYYMSSVENFLLHRPDHFLEFQRLVWNIIDWGRRKRLKDIQGALDCLLEDRRKTASESAKSRPPPSIDESPSSSKKRRAKSLYGKKTE